MNQFSFWTILLTLFALGGAVYLVNSAPANTLSERMAALPKTESECATRGGVWKTFSESPENFCELRTSDAGKHCVRSSECEGFCLAASTRRNPAAQSACSDQVLLRGCFTEAGESELCVD